MVNVDHAYSIHARQMDAARVMPVSIVTSALRVKSNSAAIESRQPTREQGRQRLRRDSLEAATYDAVNKIP